jgi:SPP1 gp7 family putative phage head morphogenesis protein
MLNYSIAKLAASNQRRRARSTVELPQIHGSLGAERSYLAALRKVLAELFKAVKSDVLPVVERELAQQRAAQRITGDIDSETFERIKQLGNALGVLANSTVQRILGLEAKRHTETFMKQAKQALGIDLTAVVRLEDLEDYLATAATRNAGLIRGLSELTIQRVQTTVTNAVLNGKTASELRKQLTADFEFSDRRAKVIARDQIAKTNSDLNRIRHTQAGITEYVWRTSRDERVRPRHERCDGKTYQYGKPTDAEEGLPPGQPILCRCIAQAIVEF